MQQAFRKLSRKYHLRGLLLQAIGDIQFSSVHFQQALGNFAFATCSDAASSWETIGKIPCKLLGTSHFKGLPLLQALGTTRFVTFSCAASYIGQEGNCNWQGCICTKPVGNLICRLLALQLCIKILGDFGRSPAHLQTQRFFITNPDGFCSCWQDDT